MVAGKPSGHSINQVFKYGAALQSASAHHGPHSLTIALALLASSALCDPPVNDLNSNWAYMVMAGLAWNLKAWYGLMMPNRERGLELVKMEFRSFLAAVILLPAQIIRAGRKIIYRMMGYNGWMKDFFATWERLRRLKAN